MRVAIFGVNGYIGQHLCRHLTDKGIKCCGFDIQSAPVIGNVCVKYEQCDVVDESWRRNFKTMEFSAIYFLSGISGPERSFVEAPLYEKVNVLGLLNLLRCVSSFGGSAPKIIFPSSRLVYCGGGAVTEDSHLEPRSVYAANKIACEGLLSAYYHRYGVPYAVLRICVPYGNLLSNTYSYGTLGFFMQQVRAGKPITVYGDGSLRKTYTYIGDVCTAFYGVMQRHEAQGIYNVGGHDYSLKEVAEMIVAANGGRVEFVPWPESAKLAETGNISLVSTKLDKAIGTIKYRRMEDCVHEL